MLYIYYIVYIIYNIYIILYILYIIYILYYNILYIYIKVSPFLLRAVKLKDNNTYLHLVIFQSL